MPRLLRAGTCTRAGLSPGFLLTTSARRSGNWVVCGRALGWYKLSRKDRTEGNWAPANRAVGGRELEQRGPSSEGSRRVIAVRTRGSPGLARSRPRTQPRSARPGSPACQGLQRKVGTRDQALRGLTPSLVVRTPALPCRQGTWANSFTSRAL